MRDMLPELQRRADAYEGSFFKDAQLRNTPQRELLREQARLVVAELQNQLRMCAGRTNVEDMVPELRERRVREYLRGDSRPCTPSTRPPSTCPTPSSRQSVAAPQLPCRLNYEDLRKVAKLARQALTAEKAALEDALEEQTDALESEARRGDGAAQLVKHGEPSTTELQQLVRGLQDMAASPNWRTLSLTTDREPMPFSPAARTSPTGRPGSSHVRQLQALAALRQAEESESRSEADDVLQKIACNGTQIAGESFDPFFDDPFG